MKKNNKGFTLIELLAVIVVLAIIMVIATQQVNGTIKKSRGDSFYETAQSIRKAAQTVCATDNNISEKTLGDAIEAADVTIETKTDKSSVKGYGYVYVIATDGGKFTNRTDPSKISSNFKLGKYSASTFDTTSNEKNAYQFEAECPIVAD